MPLNKLLNDPDLQGLIARVEEAYGRDAVSRAIVDAYAAIVREQRTQLAAGEVPDTDSRRVVRAAFRRQLEALMRQH